MLISIRITKTLILWLPIIKKRAVNNEQIDVLSETIGTETSNALPKKSGEERS